MSGEIEIGRSNGGQYYRRAPSRPVESRRSRRRPRRIGDDGYRSQVGSIGGASATVARVETGDGGFVSIHDARRRLYHDGEDSGVGSRETTRELPAVDPGLTTIFRRSTASKSCSWRVLRTSATREDAEASAGTSTGKRHTVSLPDRPRRPARRRGPSSTPDSAPGSLREGYCRRGTPRLVVDP